MGVMDKFLNYMKLNDDEDEGFYDDDYLDDEEEVEPVKKFSPAKSRQQAAEDTDLEEKSKRSVQPKVTPIHRSVTKKMPGTGMEVCVIKPTSVEDAREITETLLANRTVVLNLEGLDVDIAQRLIDFTSGSWFALSGPLLKICSVFFCIFHKWGNRHETFDMNCRQHCYVPYKFRRFLCCCAEFALFLRNIYFN